MKTILLLGTMFLLGLCQAQTGATCSDPIPLTCGQSVNGSTVGIANDNETSGVISCVAEVGIGGQIWYSYTAESDGVLTVSTVNEITDFDTKIHVYSGICGDLICVADNDDFLNLASQLEFDCIGGTNYLIRVGGFNTDEGNYQVSLTCDLDIYGCMDSAASNYESEALVDDGSCCYGMFNTMSVTPGAFAPEIGWEILDAAGTSLVSGGADDVAELCLLSGSCGYILVMTDNFGDGWNEGTYEFKDATGNVLFTGTMLDGAGPDSVFIAIGDGECPFGCMNPIADNYDPEAGFDDGSCIIPGCNDVNAQNYDPIFTFNDGSCIYDFHGYAFVDSNENGFFDVFESGLAGVEVSLAPDGLLTYTNAEGYFEFTDILGSDHNIHGNIDSEVWPTTTTNVDFNIAEYSSPYNIGVSTNEPFIHVDLTQEVWGLFFCGTSGGVWLTVQNNGNESINSTLEINLDDDLDAGNIPYIYSSNIPAFSYVVSTNGDDLILNMENILPGGYVQMMVYFDVLAPEIIGQMATNIFTLNSVSTSGLTDDQVIQTESLIQCSYDPNDISVSPAGYTDNHFILNDTPLEYTIRFQNTGNAPAYHIEVTDLIDENLDLSSFELTQASHDVVTTINLQSRVIEFDFYEIMLPDSNADEVGSHGFIKYRILPVTNLAVGTVIENTASIVFDINEPVVTNTAVSTITTCDGFGTFALNENEVCEGSTVSGSISPEFIETFNWTIDGEMVSSNNNFVIENVTTGIHEVALEVGNPLCEASSIQTFEVHEIETPTFVESGATLTANGGTYYQWYLNGTAIEGATSDTWIATENGLYSVQSTSEFGCVGTSAEVEVVVINIGELAVDELQVYPNPASTVLHVNVGNQVIRSVKIMGIDGCLIRELTSMGTGIIPVDVSDLTPGVYFLNIQLSDSTVHTARVMKQN